MNKQELKKYVEENPLLVSMRESPAYPGLFVLKYKKRVFFDGLWNDFLEECRGTIVDEDFNVVSRPFTKIYNYGVEEKAPVLDTSTQVIAYRKVNGFMVAVTWYNDDILVSTTGSLDSDFVAMARELIDVEKFKKVCSEHAGVTFMFECVHRNDPHIITEEEGLYFLGYRVNLWESTVYHDPDVLYSFAVAFGANVVEYRRFSLGELLKFIKRVRHEGYVFYTQDGVSAKIKSPYYLTLKWMARNPRIDKLLTKEFREQIDEEYYPLLNEIRDSIEEYSALSEQDRLVWIREYLSK